MIPTNNKMGPPPFPKPKAKALPLPPPPPGAPKAKAPMGDSDGDEGDSGECSQVIEQLQQSNPAAASALLTFVKAMVGGGDSPAPDLGAGPDDGSDGGM